jgi:hypothetical protein
VQPDRHPWRLPRYTRGTQIGKRGISVVHWLPSRPPYRLGTWTFTRTFLLCPLLSRTTKRGASRQARCRRHQSSGAGSLTRPDRRWTCRSRKRTRPWIGRSRERDMGIIGDGMRRGSPGRLAPFPHTGTLGGTTYRPVIGRWTRSHHHWRSLLHGTVWDRVNHWDRVAGARRDRSRFLSRRPRSLLRHHWMDLLGPIGLQGGLTQLGRFLGRSQLRLQPLHRDGPFFCLPLHMVQLCPLILHPTNKQLHTGADRPGRSKNRSHHGR